MKFRITIVLYALALLLAPAWGQTYGPSKVSVGPSKVMTGPSTVTTPGFNSAPVPVRYQRPMNQAPQGQRSYYPYRYNGTGSYYYYPYDPGSRTTRGGQAQPPMGEGQAQFKPSKFKPREFKPGFQPTKY